MTSGFPFAIAAASLIAAAGSPWVGRMSKARSRPFLEAFNAEPGFEPLDGRRRDRWLAVEDTDAVERSRGLRASERGREHDADQRGGEPHGFGAHLGTDRVEPRVRPASSIAIELDRVAVRVLDVDRAVAAAAADSHTSLRHARADLRPLGSRKVQAEVVEPARVRVEPRTGPDEVQEILPARGLEKEHAFVGKGGLEAENVDVEAFGARQVARLE